MFKNNDSIKLFLFHLLIITVLIYSWAAVANSYVNYAETHNRMTISEHVKVLYQYNGLIHLLFDPLLTYTVPLLVSFIYLGIRRKAYFLVHLAVVVLAGLVLFEMEWYIIRDSSGKIFFFSYLGLLQYSLRVAMVFVVQVVVFYKTKKALNY